MRCRIIQGDFSTEIAHEAAPTTAVFRCDVSVLKPPTSAAISPRHTWYLQLVTGHGIQTLRLRSVRVVALPSFSRIKRYCPAHWGHHEAQSVLSRSEGVRVSNSDKQYRRAQRCGRRACGRMLTLAVEKCIELVLLSHMVSRLHSSEELRATFFALHATALKLPSLLADMRGGSHICMVSMREAKDISFRSVLRLCFAFDPATSHLVRLLFCLHLVLAHQSE